MTTPNINNNTNFELKTEHKVEMAATIVSAIVLIVALGLTIHFAVKGLPPMVQITADFSMSLPLLICSSIGFAAAVTFVVQLIRHKQIRFAFERGCGDCLSSGEVMPALVRNSLHPHGRAEGETTKSFTEANFGEITSSVLAIGPTVDIPTRDGVTLRGYWSRNVNKNAPTVIVFHGNGMTAEPWVPLWKKWYQDMGYNVLVAEYRGMGSAKALPLAATRKWKLILMQKPL